MARGERREQTCRPDDQTYSPFTAEFGSFELLQTFDHLVAGAFIVPRFASDTIRKHLAVITVSFPRGVDRVVVEKLN